MPKYVTRVSVWFNSEGASPSTVIKKLLELGFTPTRGAYDFVYEHKTEEMSGSDLSSAIIEVSDALHATLSGFKVFYTLDTDIKDEANDYIPLEDIDAELEATRKEIQEIESEASNTE